MSEVLAKAVPPEPDEALLLASPPLALAPACVFEEEESEDPSSDPHAVSATASPAAPTAATMVRRAGVPVGSSDSLVMLTFPSQAHVVDLSMGHRRRSPVIQTVSRS